MLPSWLILGHELLLFILQIYDSDLLITSPGYGKSVPKNCRLSPDGWFQMAMQLAYYRMYKKVVLTYESATTRCVHCLIPEPLDWELGMRLLPFTALTT